MSRPSERFFDLYALGRVLADEIDHFVEEWHGADTPLSLPEYLGLTEAEYATWVEDARRLPFVLAKRRGQPVPQNDDDVLRLAARTTDPGVLHELQEWANKQRSS